MRSQFTTSKSLQQEGSTKTASHLNKIANSKSNDSSSLHGLQAECNDWKPEEEIMNSSLGEQL